MEQLINIVWVFLGAVMVMLMQAGFAILEAGLTRQKTSNNCFKLKNNYGLCNWINYIFS